MSLQIRRPHSDKYNKDNKELDFVNVTVVFNLITMFTFFLIMYYVIQ